MNNRIKINLKNIDNTFHWKKKGSNDQPLLNTLQNLQAQKTKKEVQ